MTEHDDGNGRVTTRMLRASIEDTRELLRAELALVRQEVQHSQQTVHERLDRICQQLEKARQRQERRRGWVGTRANSTLDKLLAAGAIAGFAILLEALIR